MKKIFLNIVSLVLILAIFLSLLAGCSSELDDSSSDNIVDTSSSDDLGTSSEDEETTLEQIEKNAKEFMEENYPSNGEVELLNDRVMVAGEEYALIRTSMGDIKIKFFPEIAPKAVENFKLLANSGDYDGLEFHRVIEELLIQTGDPTNTGASNDSFEGAPFYGRQFEDEFSEQALNLRGAVGMVNVGADTNGRQFYILQSTPEKITENMWDLVYNRLYKDYPDLVKEKYEEVGGAPWLDFQNTVFGQVFEGMEVVDAINQVELNAQTDKPVEKVLVYSIDILKYVVPRTQPSIPTLDTNTSSDISSDTSLPITE